MLDFYFTLAYEATACYTRDTISKERQSMNINVTYQPSELRGNQFWFSALNNERGSLIFECDHEIELREGVQNFMTFSGPEEYTIQWKECISCGQEWDIAGNEL